MNCMTGVSLNKLQTFCYNFIKRADSMGYSLVILTDIETGTKSYTLTKKGFPELMDWVQIGRVHEEYKTVLLMDNSHWNTLNGKTLHRIIDMRDDFNVLCSLLNEFNIYDYDSFDNNMTVVNCMCCACKRLGKRVVTRKW